MINEIYNQRILELAGNIPRLGRLAKARRQRESAFATVRVDGDNRSLCAGRAGRGFRP